MLQQLVVSGVALGAGLLLWTAWRGTDEGVDMARQAASVAPRVQAQALPSLASPVPATTARAQEPSPQPPPTTTTLVPIQVTTARTLQVGEVNELVVSVGPSTAVGEIEFTVELDPNLLQVRAGIEGDWAGGAALSARAFSAEISSAEDRVRIRSAVSRARAGATRGSVALVQFQAVAPGTTSVLITGVALKDLAGRSLVPAISPSNLQVTVDATLPPPSAQADPPRSADAQPPTVPAEDGD